MFWIVSAVLVVLAATFVLVPLWRQQLVAAAKADLLRRNTNLEIFSERRAELDQELAVGNLEASQHQELLLELQKNLLEDTSELAVATSTSFSPLVRWLPVGMLGVLLILVYPMYGLWGFYRDVAPRGLYEETFNNINGDPELARDLVVRLGEVVRDDPENPWAMYFLARNLTTLNMFAEAELAFASAVRLLDDSPDKAAVLGQYAQIRYITSGGQLTDEVMALVDAARAINPSEMSVLQLLSIDAELKGDMESAIDYWRLMIQADPNSPQAQVLRNNIAAAQQQLAGTGNDVAAAGPRIEVHVELAGSLSLPADLRVFVTARDAQREGVPPLAATQLTVADLPATVTLDNSSAMVPAFNISSADTLYITATVSRSGSANVQSGDYRVVSENFAHAGQHTIIDLVISEPVP